MRTQLPALRQGDRVGLVAPAGPVPADQLTGGVAVLESWGLEVLVGEHVGGQHPELDYLAATDAQRAEDLRRVWSSDVRAVFCARGGYGCLRMIDLVDFATLPPRIFVGSSDITMLHEVIGQQLALATVFGPMTGTVPFLGQPAAQENLRRALFEPGELLARGESMGGSSVISGMTVGGTASLLVSSLGAPGYRPPPGGAIALIEDVTEDPYRLDRIFTQLVRGGWFDTVAGIAFGSFDECGPQEDVRAAVCSVLEPLGLPMVWQLGFGHCPDQLTVPLGTTATLDAAAGTVSFAPALCPI